MSQYLDEDAVHVLGPRRAIRAQKTSEYVAHDLTTLIIERGLTEGARLPNEREMLEAFKVGRNTLREALRLLETRGLITIRTGRGGGPVVCRPQMRDLSEAMALLFALESVSFADVVHARQAVEPMLSRLASTRISAEQLLTLRSTIDVMVEKAGEQSVFLDQNLQFHSTIAEASGNVVLKIINESLKLIADGAISGIHYSARRHRQVAAAHEKILIALSAHDEKAAEAEMLAHLQDAGRYWQTKYPSMFNMSVRLNNYRRSSG